LFLLIFICFNYFVFVQHGLVQLGPQGALSDLAQHGFVQLEPHGALHGAT